MEITANALQTVTANNNVIFSDTAIPGCPSIVHREGSGLITLRGLAKTQRRARFRATFGANIAIPEEQDIVPISLAIAIDGEPVGPTIMTVTPGAENQFFNVSSDIFLDVPLGCCSRISVKNVSPISVAVQNANLIVERVA